MNKTQGVKIVSGLLVSMVVVYAVFTFLMSMALKMPGMENPKDFFEALFLGLSIYGVYKLVTLSKVRENTVALAIQGITIVLILELLVLVGLQIYN